MADALASGASEGNLVGVQVPPRPLCDVARHRQCPNPRQGLGVLFFGVRGVGRWGCRCRGSGVLSWVSPPGPDRGIDIVAYTDPLGATGPRIKAQVKRRADKSNVDGIRAFLAVLGPHDVGIFISTAGFTSDAERAVRSQENRRITLIDMEKLFDLWVEHYASIADSDKSLMPIVPVYFLASRE